jgi:hypothetical protein
MGESGIGGGGSPAPVFGINIDNSTPGTKPVVIEQVHPPAKKQIDEDWHTLLALAGLIAVVIIGLLQHQITTVQAAGILLPIVGGAALYAQTQK